jgi:ceramide glucosyltransferase
VTPGLVVAASGLAGLLVCLVSFALAASSLRRHRRDGRGEDVPGFSPPVSIVKPLSGLDDDLSRNLESFYRLDYPEYEVVFSFASESDPAYGVARRVSDAHPAIRTVFVFDRLAAGVRRARYGHLLFSDGNVRVRPDFLTRAVSFFADRRVGLVSSLFSAYGAVTLGSRIESLHLNGFLQAGTAFLVRKVRRTCVVGKSILVSREALEAMGGFAPLENFLAEDFLLGERAEDAGYRVVLSGDEVETAEVHKSLASVWARHRRWAILRARLGGICYASELFASPAGWFGVAAAGALATPHPAEIVALAAFLWAARSGVECALAADAGRPLPAADVALIPVRDLGVAALFWAGLIGRRTRWRGRTLEVGRGTLLMPVRTRSARVGETNGDIGLLPN